jgi:hypothetical protein
MCRPILFLLCLSPAFAEMPRLGTVQELSEPCPASPVPNTSCRKLLVTCPDLKPLEVQIRITQPAAGVPLRGTVVMGSGAGGGSFYAMAPPVQELVKQISEMGFLVVDRAWKGGWTTHEGGLKKESCRYATLLTWVHDHLHKGGKFAATGNSGGSAEIGYALTTWGRGDILDLAIPSSGPPVARLDLACVKEPSAEWKAMCASIVPQGKMECASQCTLGASNDVCKQVAAQPTPEQLHDDSVVHPGALLDYPRTRLHFLYGAKDCGEPVPIGLTWATKVRSRKQIDFVPNTPHSIFQTPEGREAVRRAIDEGTAEKTN